MQAVVAVRFCPVLFEAEPGEEGPFELPYRMVFAVATLDSVVLYDTSNQGPLAMLGSLHCESAPITDMAWSCDGHYLAVSSYDGKSASCSSSSCSLLPLR
jgi:chromatin assembly factor 1 subunit B